MRNMIGYAWKETRRRKGRSMGTMLGYLVAVAFLVITITFAGISRFGAAEALQYTGAQFIGIIYDAGLEGGGVEFRDAGKEGLLIYNNPTVLFPVSLAEEVGRSPNVRNAAPLLTFTVRTDEYVERSWILSGFDASDMESVRMVSCSATDIVEGRLIEPGDSDVVLLEQTFADAEQYGVGDILYFDDREFEVVGILSPGIRPVKADIYMTLDDANWVLNTRIEEPVHGVINAVLVDGASSLANRSAMNDTREILGFNSSTIGYGCFSPAGTAIGITARGMQLLGLIVFITILLLVMSSQYYSVVERDNDIGILKAIGWSDRNVVSQVIGESFLHSVIGGLAGVAIATFLIVSFPVGQWLGLEESFTATFDPLVLIAGFFLTVLAGVIAGFISALVSLRLKPAEILRKL